MATPPASLPIGALEIGGTHVSAARVEGTLDAPRTGAIQRLSLPADGTRDELLSAILATARSASGQGLDGWGVAVPGPFDYEAGICRIRGVAKLETLYGVDLRSELAATLDAPPHRIAFLNDADAFLLGEAWAGAARGFRRTVGITLGTGLGSAFLVEGRITEEGPGVPPEGRLDLLTLDGRPVEDSISTRGLLATYRHLAGDRPHAAQVSGAAELSARARDGDDHAIHTFDRLGTDLGRVLTPTFEAFQPECLVVGGSIAAAWDLFGPALQRECSPMRGPVRSQIAHHLESAALLGAARRAFDGG